jgi:type III pantothenate kinase
MLLLIDIGNTNTTIGFYENDKISGVLHIKTESEESSHGKYPHMLDEHITRQNMEKPAGAALCSVVPDAAPAIAGALKNCFDIEPVTVNHQVKTGLTYNITNIDTLGADRIANAAAAYKLYQEDIIIVDFGTATTFCAVTGGGEYRGGAIMPGIALSMSALAEKTAKLPAVELKKPQTVLGRNTEENILSGVMFGHAGAAERIIREIQEETGRNHRVVATGGFSDVMASYIKTIDYVNPLLTLEGLRFIYEMNS